MKKFCGNCKFYLHKGQCKISKKLICIYTEACRLYKRIWYKFWVKEYKMTPEIAIKVYWIMSLGAIIFLIWLYWIF